jgi:hypothetical protein
MTPDKGRASDRRNCNLSLDTSPPERPDPPCEPQLRGNALAIFNWTGHVSPKVANVRLRLRVILRRSELPCESLVCRGPAVVNSGSGGQGV